MFIKFEIICDNKDDLYMMEKAIHAPTNSI